MQSIACLIITPTEHSINDQRIDFNQILIFLCSPLKNREYRDL